MDARILFCLLSMLGYVWSKQPHIMFIVADDLGWNDVGFNNKDMLTPVIDKLASEGLILNQSYVQPLCSPSRHAFMTGYYPFHAGLQHLVIYQRQPVCSPLNMTFLPQHLKKLGYATHMVGKWHLGFCNWNCTPTYRGFDSFFGYYNSQEDYYTHSWDGLDYRDNEKIVTDKNGTYSIFSFQQRTMNIIDSHDPRNPLFLYLPFQNVHDPIEVPKAYEDKYPNVQHEGRRKFSGMVSILDDVIGNITNRLQEKGMLDDTLIIFTADNGGWTIYDGNNYPLRGGKFTIYEGGTRAVGFIKGPGLTVTGKRYDGLIHAVDWLPTIVAAAGGQIGNEIDGINQWDAIKSFTNSPRTEIVYNIDDVIPPVQGHAAIRIGKYKLIDGYPGLYPFWYKPASLSTDLPSKEVMYEEYLQQNSIRFKLYDLEADPTERNDLSENHPEIVKKLSARLEEYHKTIVPANFPAEVPAAYPQNFGGAWTPGWC